MSSRKTGWMAVGFSPARLEDGRLEHERRVELAQRTNTPPPPAWDSDSYMRRAKAEPIRSTPFATKAAAEDAVRVAHTAGWRGCYVQSRR